MHTAALGCFLLGGGLILIDFGLTILDFECKRSVVNNLFKDLKEQFPEMTIEQQMDMFISIWKRVDESPSIITAAYN